MYRRAADDPLQRRCLDRVGVGVVERRRVPAQDERTAVVAVLDPLDRDGGGCALVQLHRAGGLQRRD
jgi:hypothetical protein